MKKVTNLLLILFALAFAGCEKENGTEPIITDGNPIDILDYYPFAGYSNVYRDWDAIGTYSRLVPVSFTNDAGETHYYEIVEIPNGDVEWLECAYLAQLSGGYLVCPETEEENEFVFGLIDKENYWYKWDATHYYVTSGPPVGAFQAADYSETSPSSGWMWLSGETMNFTKWCRNLDDGVLDTDPRNNNQPNDATGDQDAACYGEITSRVSNWGDFPIRFGDLQGGEGATFYAFVIEYEQMPD